MTIDTDDNLWVALYGGGSVIKVNPKTGNLLKVISNNERIQDTFKSKTVYR